MKSLVTRVMYNGNNLEILPHNKTVVNRIKDIMVKNRYRSMDETVDVIMKEIPLNPARAQASARSYYIDLVRAGAAPGNIEFHQRGRKSSSSIIMSNKPITIVLSKRVRFVGYLQEEVA